MKVGFGAFPREAPAAPGPRWAVIAVVLFCGIRDFRVASAGGSLSPDPDSTDSQKFPAGCEEETGWRWHPHPRFGNVEPKAPLPPPPPPLPRWLLELFIAHKSKRTKTFLLMQMKRRPFRTRTDKKTLRGGEDRKLRFNYWSDLRPFLLLYSKITSNINIWLFQLLQHHRINI